MLHKQGLLEVTTFSLIEAVSGRDSDRSHWDGHQECKANQIKELQKWRRGWDSIPDCSGLRYLAVNCKSTSP